MTARPDAALSSADSPHALRADAPLSPVTVREASFADYDRIAALHARNNLSLKSQEDWIALWRGNPAYRIPEGHWPIGWVLESREGDIVGSIGNIPSAFRFQSMPVQGATAGSWVVDSRYRGYAMLLPECLMKQENVPLFVATKVSETAEPAFEALRWSRVPVGDWRTEAFWITSHRGFARAMLRTKRVPFAGAISYPASVLPACLELMTSKRVSAYSPPVEIDICRSFDGRFDHFWEELESASHDVLLAVRDRETLEWHFRASLSRGCAWILTASRGSGLVGYLICVRQEDPVSGLTRARLIDFQALPGYQEVLPVLLHRALKMCAEQRIDVLDVIGGWPGQTLLPALVAPHHRTLTSWNYYYKAASSSLAEVLRNAGVWRPSALDGNASL
jgi:hypothetical protein